MGIRYYAPDGRMSDVVTHENTLYISGQICMDDPGMQEQAEGTLAIIDDLLNKNDSDKRHILNATIYLANMQDLPSFNAVWDRWVEHGREPARTCIGAAMANKACLVEISVVAAKK